MSKTLYFVFSTFLSVTTLLGQICKPTAICTPSVKSQCVSDCSQACGDDGDCIFGCESGQFSAAVECESNCSLFGPTCLPNCYRTVDCINSGCPSVTTQLNIVPGVVVYNRVTKVWQQTLVITNTSCDPITGLGLFLDSLASGWGLTNNDGVTWNGIAYKKVSALGPLATTTITLQFSRTGTTALTYTSRAMSGLYIDPVVPQP